MDSDQLVSEANRVLIDGVPKGLKSAIDRLLARGYRADSMTRLLDAMIDKAGNAPLLKQGCYAYIESKTREEPKHAD